MVLIFISLITNGVEHPFTCLSVCIYSLKSLFNLVVYKGSLHISRDWKDREGIYWDGAQ